MILLYHFQLLVLTLSSRRKYFQIVGDNTFSTLFPVSFIVRYGWHLRFTTAYEHGAANIDGKSIAEEIRSSIAFEVRRMKESIGQVPGLAVIVVGQRWDSQTYVRNKILACEEAGMKSVLTKLPDNCREDEILDALVNYNEDTSVHGILVQLPLPQVISSTVV